MNLLFVRDSIAQPLRKQILRNTAQVLILALFLTTCVMQASYLKHSVPQLICKIAIIITLPCSAIIELRYIKH